MATEKTPIRTVFADDGSAEGLAEFQTGEVIPYEHGGTGLDALGSANQVLQVAANGSAIVWGDKTQVDLDPYLQVANAVASFQTKAEALTANNTLVSLINDRIQVANVISLINAEVTNLIDGAPGALDTLNELAAAIGDDANFFTTITNDLATKSSNTYVHATFVPKSASIALTGDVSGSATFSSNSVSITADIAATGTPTGTFGSSSQVPIITVAADGRITNISNTSVAGVTAFEYTEANNTFTISTADGGSFKAKATDIDRKLEGDASVTLTGDVTGSANFSANAISITTDISSTGTPTGTFGSSSQVPIVTVAADGRITNISNTSVAGVTGFTYASGNNTFTITTADGGVFSASADELDTYQTKAEAVASNNAIVSLVQDRLQVANAQALFVNVSGDTMSGALAMGSNKITGLGAPTADTDASTKKYVDDEIAGLVNSAPAALDTLNELAAALGDDANFATTVTNSIATKASNTYVNSTFQTKTEALNANNSMLSLVQDRLQVANAIALYQTKSEALTSNNNVVSLIENRLEVANAVPLIRSSLSVGSGISYNSGTGVFSLPIGYQEVTSNTTVTSNDDGKFFNIRSSATPVFRVTLPSGSELPDGFSFNVITSNVSSIIFAVSNTSDVFINRQSFTAQQINFVEGEQIDDYDEISIGDPNSSLFYSRVSSSFQAVYLGNNKFILKEFVDSTKVGQGVWTQTTQNIIAQAGDKLFVDTSTGPVTVTLPYGPALGDEIRIVDATGNANTNNITINRNGSNINALGSNFVLSVPRSAVGLAYFNEAQGWVFTEKTADGYVG